MLHTGDEGLLQGRYRGEVAVGGVFAGECIELGREF
jgi:hypothetical protein